MTIASKSFPESAITLSAHNTYNPTSLLQGFSYSRCILFGKVWFATQFWPLCCLVPFPFFSFCGGSFSEKHTHSKKVPLLFLAFCHQSFREGLVNLVLWMVADLVVSWGTTFSFRLEIWTISVHITKQAISLKNKFREVWLDLVFIIKTGTISINYFEIFLN